MPPTDPSFRTPSPEPLEILPAPGAVEAAAIRADHAVATAGMRAFVRMGFRLMDVKSRLPHGKYVKWCEEYLGDLSRPHLHRAKFIASYFSQMCPVETFEELPSSALEIIDGTNGGQSLMAAIHEFPDLTAEEHHNEAACAAQCEKLWLAAPEKRDEWEPRVLSGEITYHRALTGMLGSQRTAGQPKQAERHNELMETAAAKLKKHLVHFEALPPLAQASVVEYIEEMAAAMPQACRTAMLEVWKGGAA